MSSNKSSARGPDFEDPLNPEIRNGRLDYVFQQIECGAGFIQIPYQNRKIKSSGKNMPRHAVTKKRKSPKPNDPHAKRRKCPSEKRSTFACGVCADPASKNGPCCAKTLLCTIKRLLTISGRGQRPALLRKPFCVRLSASSEFGKRSPDHAPTTRNRRARFPWGLFPICDRAIANRRYRLGGCTPQTPRDNAMDPAQR